MPDTARRLGVTDPDTLYQPGAALAWASAISQCCSTGLDGNLLELGRRL